MEPASSERKTLTTAFLRAARTYWLSVFPLAHRELRYWRHRANQIPDPRLRAIALSTQNTKYGNIEGAAAFATFVPRARRALVVRALVAWQAAYDYADTLAEQPNADPEADSFQLHSALFVALEHDSPHPDYYAYNPLHRDGGYLKSLTDTARVALNALPSITAITESAHAAAKRIVIYQSLNHGKGNTHEALARWATQETPPDITMGWWETSAACASSLTVLALIAAAASTFLQPADVDAIQRAYFPWIGALHTLLDSFIDLHEDADTGQQSLLRHYDTPHEMATRMRTLAAESRLRANALPNDEHLLILAAMASQYLADPKLSSPDQRPVVRGVLTELGGLAKPAMLILTVRHTVSRFTTKRMVLRSLAHTTSNLARTGTGPTDLPDDDDRLLLSLYRN